MKQTSFWSINLIVLLAVTWLLGCSIVDAADSKISVLIVDGQNNHNWAETTPVMKDILEKTGRFQVDVCTSPKEAPKQLTDNSKESMDKWKKD